MENDDFEEFSTRSNIRKVNKFIEPSLDKNAHKVVIKNNKSAVVFSSGDRGSYIRNAVTGLVYGKKHIVGSHMEDLYWTASISVGKDSKKFFFDSPEQYEKHFGCNVDKDVNNGEELRLNWSSKAMGKQLSLKN